MSFLFRLFRPASAPSSELPVPIQLWYRDEVSRTELRAALATPGVQRAISTLKELAMPTAHQVVAVSSEEAARREAWLAGYCDFVRDLERLAREVPAQLQEDEWSYINRPQQPSYLDEN